MKVALTFAIGLLVGLALSPLVWRSPEPQTAALCDARPVPLQPEPLPSSVPLPAERPSDGADRRAAGSLSAEVGRVRSFARNATGAGLDLIARGVIDHLEEDSLKALIASATDFTSAELDEVEDLPAFAMNLARIAMEGTVREASKPETDVRPIDFSAEVTADNRAAAAQSQFFIDEERIYAVFDSEDLRLSETLAKWTRVSDGEILLFKRHAIRKADASSYVYLDAPPEGWEPGEYRVDFYTADTELRWVASGEHRITI